MSKVKPVKATDGTDPVRALKSRVGTPSAVTKATIEQVFARNFNWPLDRVRKLLHSDAKHPATEE